MNLQRRKLLRWLAVLPLAGCTPTQIRRGVYTADRVLAGDVTGAVSGQIPSTGVPMVDQLVRRQVASLITRIADRWTDRRVATPKAYVKYTEHYQSRAIVDFEAGTVRVETQREDPPEAALRRAIVSTLLTPEDPATVDLLSDREIGGDGPPFLYRLVVDQDGEFIRWPWRAGRYADHLLRTAYRVETIDGRRIHLVTFDLVREYRERQQFKFQHHVLLNARRFDQPPDLIYAIIEAESGFNPYAMSHAPAYGLMQIVPTTAGRDAHRLLYGRDGIPSRDYLFVPENNIRMGAAYLHLLDTRYLAAIGDPRSRTYCMVAAYNTGSGNVLRTFHDDRDRAAAAINRMVPDEVYEYLVRHLPHQETRDYLTRVVRYREKYRDVA